MYVQNLVLNAHTETRTWSALRQVRPHSGTNGKLISAVGDGQEGLLVRFNH
jgi:hypothetical protein